MRVRTKKIEIPGKEGHYHIREYDDFEFVNPIDQIASMFISSHMSFDRSILTMKGFEAPDEWIEEFLFKRALKEWINEYKRISSTKLPANLFQLLEAQSKKEQIKALKGLSMTSDELIAFIIMSTFFSWPNLPT